MESSGVPGAIQVSDAVYQRLKDTYVFEPRGTFSVKGVGEVTAYLLIGKKAL